MVGVVAKHPRHAHVARGLHPGQKGGLGYGRAKAVCRIKMPEGGGRGADFWTSRRVNPASPDPVHIDPHP